MVLSAVVYFDASALVKLVVEEDGSDLAAVLWDRCDVAVTSRLSYPEVCAALAASQRDGDLAAHDLEQALAGFDRYWAAVRPVELTERVQDHAGRLARTHALRGADAVHLASALVLADTELVLAAWDVRLAAGASAWRAGGQPPARVSPRSARHASSATGRPTRFDLPSESSGTNIDM